MQLIFDSAIDLLSEEDRKLNEIAQIRPFLLRGIGVHHSGLLPIVKEVVEILFGESLIKVYYFENGGILKFSWGFANTRENDL